MHNQARNGVEPQILSTLVTPHPLHAFTSIKYGRLSASRGPPRDAKKTVSPSDRCVDSNRVVMYRILTEFKVFMYWKDPPRANRDAEPRSGEALRFVRAGLSST